MRTTVRELMSVNPVFAQPDESVRDAGIKMKEYDCGFLPVGTPEKLEGVITDRDIVVRGLAGGADPSGIKVRDCMTQLAVSCSPDESMAQAVEKMREHGVSRLVVLDDEGVCRGVLSFGTILRNQVDDEETSQVVGNMHGQGMQDRGIAGSII